MEARRKRVVRCEKVHGFFLPKKFFVTSGVGLSEESVLNAFDEALMKARIAQCNLVSVSSIIPPDCEQISFAEITPGTITFAVLCRMDGRDGETIGVGIGWCWGEKAGKKESYGIVAEDHGYKNPEEIEKAVRQKLKRMAKVRDLTIDEGKINVRMESLVVPKNTIGSVVVAFVYVPFTVDEGSRKT